jgi:hypothetical protein
VVATGLVGRERELAVLTGTWALACRGEARVVCVEGVAGIGKTALVREFTGEAGGTVLWASGDEDETGLPWGVLSQLPVGSLAGQADPVFAARALADVLRAEGNVVLVIDDAQWADRLSLVALRLAVRRLGTDPVLLIMIRQTGSSVELDDGWRRLLDSDRGSRLEVDGLAPAELVRLAVPAVIPG